jgi:hypothetical protein
VSQYAPWAHPKQAGQGRGVVQNTILCVPSCLSSSLFFCHHCSLRLILLTGNAHIVLSPSPSAPLSTPPQFCASFGLQQLDSRATPINAVSASFDAFLCLCHLQSATTPPGRGSPMGAMAHLLGTRCLDEDDRVVQDFGDSGSQYRIYRSFAACNRLAVTRASLRWEQNLILFSSPT